MHFSHYTRDSRMGISDLATDHGDEEESKRWIRSMFEQDSVPMIEYL